MSSGHPVTEQGTWEVGRHDAVSQALYRATGTSVRYRPITNGRPTGGGYTWRGDETGMADAEVTARVAAAREQALTRRRDAELAAARQEHPRRFWYHHTAPDDLYPLIGLLAELLAGKDLP
jgi:hypothetical protein